MTTLAPGQDVQLVAQTTTRGLPTDTGVAFLPILAERGPTDVPVRCRSLADVEEIFGGRVASSLAWDYMDCAFNTGLADAWVIRVGSTGMAKASRNLNDGAGAPLVTMRAEARYFGSYGNALAVQVVAGSSGSLRTLVVFEGGVDTDDEVVRYADLASPAEIAAAAALDPRLKVSDMVSGTAAPDNLPAVMEAPALLTGGSDGDPATDDDWTVALSRLPKDLGPGQVAMTGRSTTAAHLALAAHAEQTNRLPLFDGPNLPTEQGMLTLAAAVAGRKGGMFSKWVTLPGLVPGQTRAVPASAAVIGHLAARDADVAGGGRPGAPAGGRGSLPYVTGLSGGNWTDAERNRLHKAGVNALRQSDAFGVQIYGFRSTSDVRAWYDLTTVREGMAIKAVHGAILERYVLAQIDGITLSDLRRDLLQDLDARAVAGRIRLDYDADTGPTVNTPTTMAARELHSTASFACFPTAERVIERVVNFSA